VALNYGLGLIVSKEKLSPMFYKKKTNHKTGTGGELYICLTISFLTLGEAQCDTVIVVIVVTETEK
jgi:hypothetical protein